jgi:hypothetical protein
MAYDAILDQKNEVQQREFVQRFVSAIDNIMQFVANRLGWSRDAEYVGVKKGSFNASLVARNVDDGSKVLILLEYLAGNPEVRWEPAIGGVEGT